MRACKNRLSQAEVAGKSGSVPCSLDHEISPLINNRMNSRLLVCRERSIDHLVGAGNNGVGTSNPSALAVLCPLLRNALSHLRRRTMALSNAERQKRGRDRRN